MGHQAAQGRRRPGRLSLALPRRRGTGKPHHTFPSHAEPRSHTAPGPACDRCAGKDDHLDRDRHGKVAWLAAERPDLPANAKVCYQHATSANCGRCHKCALTMASLRADRRASMSSWRRTATGAARRSGRRRVGRRGGCGRRQCRRGPAAAKASPTRLVAWRLQPLPSPQPWPAPHALSHAGSASRRRQ